MWKRISTGLVGFLKKVTNSPVAGPILWAVFVGRMTPPGTSDLESAFLVVTSMAGICLLANGMCRHIMKMAVRQGRADLIER